MFAARTARSNYDIYVSRLNGTGLKRLTRSPLIDEHPSWAPDGRRIVFMRTKAAPLFELWIMNADGTHQRRLGLGRAQTGRRTGSRSRSLALSTSGSCVPTGRSPSRSRRGRA